MNGTANEVSPLNPDGIGFATIQVGNIEIFQIFDGTGMRGLDPSGFKNVALSKVASALEEAGFPAGKLPNSYTVTIMRVGGRLIMFDAGNGEAGHPNSGHLHRNMRAAGLDPKDISQIVVTHFHADHIFGLMTATNEQVYPDIEILVPATEYDFWTDPACLDLLPPARAQLAKRIQATLPTWRNICRFEDEQDVLPGIRAVPTYGHSPGHTSFLVSSGETRIMVTADITNVPFLNMHHPDWHLAADYDPQAAAQTRHRMLEWLAAEEIICTGYHWGMPGIGRIRVENDGYVLEPLTP